MEAIATAFKVTLPSYLKSLPIPNSLAGYGELSGEHWLRLLPFFLAVTIIFYSLARLILPSGSRKPAPINLTIKKESPKVVNVVDIEDLDKDKISYCRCWRSSKFPYCDGTHNKHNEESGDNVGPLVYKKPTKK